MNKMETGSYQFEIQDGKVNVRSVIEALIADIRNGAELSILSARFHNSVANMTRDAIKQINHESALKEIVLSGGVWQNMALLGRTVQKLQGEGFDVKIHHQIPTNDGGLALGQALVGAARIIIGQPAD